MKAVILSAGRGRRLSTLTNGKPKCLLNIHGQTIVEWQVDELAKCGVDQVTVVVGYGADHVERVLSDRYGAGRVATLFNPFFAVSDNLASCWLARDRMDDDFLLLNGDTLFEAAVLRRLLDAPARPVTLATDHKARYDDDDMKVSLHDRRLVAVGKDLAPEHRHGEAIGMILFRDDGPQLFRERIDRTVRTENGLRKYYLSSIQELAPTCKVWTCPIQGLQWAEVDFPADYHRALEIMADWTGGAGRLAQTG